MIYRCTCGPDADLCEWCRRCTWCADHSACPLPEPDEPEEDE